MHKFGYWYEGLIFIIIFSVVLAVPCVAVAMMGSKLIQNLGQYPSRGVKSHLAIALPLLAAIILSFGLFALFFYFFSE